MSSPADPRAGTRDHAGRRGPRFRLGPWRGSPHAAGQWRGELGFWPPSPDRPPAARATSDRQASALVAAIAETGAVAPETATAAGNRAGRRVPDHHRRTPAAAPSRARARTKSPASYGRPSKRSSTTSTAGLASSRRKSLLADDQFQIADGEDRDSAYGLRARRRDDQDTASGPGQAKAFVLPTRFAWLCPASHSRSGRVAFPGAARVRFPRQRAGRPREGNPAPLDWHWQVSAVLNPVRELAGSWSGRSF